MKRQLRVGIDAKWYFDGPASGKMVVRNLVNEINRGDSNIKFFFILDEKSKNQHLDIENITNEKIYIWSGNNLISNVFFIPRLARKHKLDVVLYQTSISCFGKHKKIAYIHDLIYVSHPEYYTLLERIYLKPIKFLTRFSDFIITVSNFEKTRFEKLNFSDKEVIVLHHGFDPNFKPAQEFDSIFLEKVKHKFKLPKEYILYVGRINTRKNVPSLIKAFSQINMSIPLVLVGNQEWKTDNISKLIKELNLSDKIILTGPLYGEELAAVYSLSTLFCFPSFEESFGLPPLEAMASGVPVIVSNSSSLPEVCGNAALYVDAKNINELSNEIITVLNDNDLRNKLSQLSLERSTHFSWKKTTDSLINILENKYLNIL